jgi:hypothetical protein
VLHLSKAVYGWPACRYQVWFKDISVALSWLFLRKKNKKYFIGGVIGSAIVTAVSITVFGWQTHRVLFLQILPWAFRGEAMDPYNATAASFTTLLHRLFVVDQSGKSSSLGTEEVRYPAVSPDGHWVAYSQLQSGNWHLWLRDLRNGQTNRLTEAGCNNMEPAWTGAMVYRALPAPYPTIIGALSLIGSFGYRNPECLQDVRVLSFDDVNKALSLSSTKKCVYLYIE